MSQLPAARLGDPVAHTLAMPGALMGIAAGVLIGAVIIGTGGLGAIAVGAAIGMTGGLGLAGQYIGESIMGPPTGAIILGSPNVLINRRQAARTVLSFAICAKEYGVPQPQATGAASVYINGQPAGRETEKIQCSAVIIAGSANVMIGGPSVQVLPLTPEVPAWLNTTLQVMAIGGAIIATGGVAATYGIGMAIGGLAGGLIGGYLGGIAGRAAASALGFGETGQRVAEVFGGFLGGMLGGGLGSRAGQKFNFAPNRTPTTTLSPGDKVPKTVIRRDNNFQATRNERGALKSRLDEDGNMVPANPNGNISTTSHVRGGNSQNSNATSTTDPRVATNPRSYGNQEIKINTGRLQRDIDAGKVEGVSIRTPAQVRQDLQNNINTAQTRYNANPTKGNRDRLARAEQDLNNSIRDGECLIFGTVPSRYISGPKPVGD